MSGLKVHTAPDIQTDIPHLAAQNGLTEWHRVVAASDWDSLPALLTDDVVFRNPAAIDAYHGKGTMVAILRAVFAVMQDFSYLRHFGSATGYVLEFSARVGEDIVFGVDLLEFNQDGKITDFMVMMRPASTVLNLAAESGKLLSVGQAPAA
jgi:hypothetical protein